MPHLAIFQRGRAAAAMLFAVIERKPRLGGEEDMAAAEFAARCSLAPAVCSPLAEGTAALAGTTPARSSLAAIAEDSGGERAVDAHVGAAASPAELAGGSAWVAPPAVASGALVATAGAGFQLVPAGGCMGKLELDRVTFAYPARPQRNVLRGLSLAFPAGEAGREGPCWQGQCVTNVASSRLCMSAGC